MEASAVICKLSEASTAKVVDLCVEKVNELTARVAALKKTAPNDDPYFLGLGTSADIPPALRLAEGKRIRNRRMVKRDVEFLVHSLFKRKAIDDREKKERDLEPLNFDEFFAAELGLQPAEPEQIATLDQLPPIAPEPQPEDLPPLMAGDAPDGTDIVITGSVTP